MVKESSEDGTESRGSEGQTPDCPSPVLAGFWAAWFPLSSPALECRTLPRLDTRRCKHQCERAMETPRTSADLNKLYLFICSDISESHTAQKQAIRPNKLSLPSAGQTGVGRRNDLGGRHREKEELG